MTGLRAKSLTVLLLALSACAGEEPAATGGMDDERFIDVTADLRRIASDTDSADFADARDSVLALHEVDAEELQTFTERAATDPDRIAGLWQAVEMRLQASADSARLADSTAAAASARPDTTP